MSGRKFHDFFDMWCKYFNFGKQSLSKSISMVKYFITRKELAEELHVDVKTLRSWIKRKDILIDHGLIPILKVKEIKEKFKLCPPDPEKSNAGNAESNNTTT